jgi:hypothetical protein
MNRIRWTILTHLSAVGAIVLRRTDTKHADCVASSILRRTNAQIGAVKLLLD